MRVRDLRSVLDELRSIFTAGGAKSQDLMLGRVSAALGKQDGQDLQAYLARVRSAAEVRAIPLADVYAKRLSDAGLDEELFLSVLAEMQHKNLTKSDWLEVAKTYIGNRAPKTGAISKLIDAIKLSFYERIYERDARSMARRATPV